MVSGIQLHAWPGDHIERWEVHVVGTSTEWGHILVYRDDTYDRIK